MSTSNCKMKTHCVLAERKESAELLRKVHFYLNRVIKATESMMDCFCNLRPYFSMVDLCQGPNSAIGICCFVSESVGLWSWCHTV